jgi:hypothetical protein
MRRSVAQAAMCVRYWHCASAKTYASLLGTVKQRLTHKLPGVSRVCGVVNEILYGFST